MRHIKNILEQNKGNHLGFLNQNAFKYTTTRFSSLRKAVQPTWMAVFVWQEYRGSSLEEVPTASVYGIWQEIYYGQTDLYFVLCILLSAVVGLELRTIWFLHLKILVSSAMFEKGLLKARANNVVSNCSLFTTIPGQECMSLIVRYWVPLQWKECQFPNPICTKSLSAYMDSLINQKSQQNINVIGL